MLARAPRPLIAFERVGFSAGGRALLSAVSVAIGDGAPTVLLGPNGAGKTTLLKLAMGLIAPTSGVIANRSCDEEASPRKAFVFQKPVMLRRSVAANIGFALTTAGRPAEPRGIAGLLEQVGLAGHGSRPARKLSGGQQQRLALARALARAPDILFLDEPTASLDPASTKAVEDIIADVSMRGVKVVMSTHDLGEAKRLAGDIVFLANGMLVEHAPAADFFREPSSQTARRFLAGDIVI